MNAEELKIKYAIVVDAMPFKYRIWKNNKVVKSGSLDKDDETTLMTTAKMSGKDWDKITLHDPKMKQLKRVNNSNSVAKYPGTQNSIIPVKKEQPKKKKDHDFYIKLNKWVVPFSDKKTQKEFFKASDYEEAVKKAAIFFSNFKDQLCDGRITIYIKKSDWPCATCDVSSKLENHKWYYNAKDAANTSKWQITASKTHLE